MEQRSSIEEVCHTIHRAIKDFQTLSGRTVEHVEYNVTGFNSGNGNTIYEKPRIRIELGQSTINAYECNL